MKKIKEFIRAMYHEELEIQHKLLNLIMTAVFAGGLASLIVTFFLHQGAEVTVSISFMIFVAGLALWLANKKKRRPNLAAVILVFAANLCAFPFMYFTSGGMTSGMPIWFVLGLTFSWLLLKGVTCAVMYLLNFLVVVACILIELIHPEYISRMESETAVCLDFIQSILVVTCIFGCIFKYQTFVYEKQKKQLEKANKTKSEFLANMSHELRTPINVMLGYNELIREESRESNTTMNAMKVEAAGRTLLSLVNDILDYTAIEEGEVAIKREVYDIREMLQDILRYAWYGTDEKRLELQVEIDPAIPQKLRGDAKRLMQVMENLISNAVKYTKEGYVKVVVRWQEGSDEGGVLWFQVKDTGIGMKKEDMERISEQFIRFDSKHTRNIQGIGLGLTIVTKLLQHMGSSLEVESEKGKGSTMSFRLLQERESADSIGEFSWEEEIQKEEREENMEAPDARILVVDDNEMNLDLMRGLLEKTKIRIDTAKNGEEAVACAKKHSYHLILMDHMMPVMDGQAAMQLLRKERICDNTPIVVLTANAVSGARQEYLAAGFDDFLSKPVVNYNLIQLLKKHLPQELCVCGAGDGTIKKAKSTADKKQLEKILDYKVGLQYCGDNEGIYKEMLASYLSNNRHAQICKFYEEKDWEQYRILVHALKSTSLMIGAVKLSEQAKELEYAARDHQIEIITENHDETMQEYERLLSLLGKELGRESAGQKELEKTEDRERILVVDDDLMNVKIAERLLHSYYFVDCVTSGQDALEYLKKERPNLILLDLHMPEMDGFEVIQRIKEQEALQDIPVIFLTADNDSEAEVRGFRKGALDFIKKPFIADIMLQRIQRILELDRLQKNLQQEVEKQTRTAEQRREKVERLSLQIMLTLGETIDAKDKYTNGHSVRVAQYAREIAKRAGKSAQEQEDIYYIGLLHDIGKIGIPNQIINKTSGLTEEEYKIMKDHARIGSDILGTMTEIPGLSVGAHWHHELYNGSGYPDGLVGEEIPEIARIIGVSDAYDAMTSQRSYRDVMPQEVVKEELRKGSGTQFDPQFVEIMLQMMEEDTEYRLCARTN